MVLDFGNLAQASYIRYLIFSISFISFSIYNFILLDILVHGRNFRGG